MTMEIRPLSKEEQAALDDGYKLAKRVLNETSSLAMSQIQHLYDVVLREHADNETILIALGIAFGEQLKTEEDLEWVRVSDEYGEETALSLKGLKVASFPISMIQKRIARKETMNLNYLKDAVINDLRMKRTSGEYDKR